MYELNTYTFYTCIFYTCIKYLFILLDFRQPNAIPTYTQPYTTYKPAKKKHDKRNARTK